MIIIHHNKDLDGFSSGAVCELKYPNATLIGWDYKDEIPDFEQLIGQDVIMIDISFPIEKIKVLSDICNLTIIDHHISFKKEMDELENTNQGLNIIYIYEDGVAACEIGWKYLFPCTKIPRAITLLGRYDTWRKDEGNWNNETLPFQFYMRTVCISPETFPTEFFKTDTKLIDYGVMTGISILQYQKQQDLLNCQRYSFDSIVGGLSAICVNVTAFSSETCKSVYNPDKHDIMVGFSFTGLKWIVSLRSDKPDIDVSVIAKARGGGGHKAAAGFEVNVVPKARQ